MIAIGIYISRATAGHNGTDTQCAGLTDDINVAADAIVATSCRDAAGTDVAATDQHIAGSDYITCQCAVTGAQSDAASRHGIVCSNINQSCIATIRICTCCCIATAGSECGGLNTAVCI